MAMNKALLSLALLTLSGLVFAQTEASKKETQTDYILDAAPTGLLTIPAEAIYRLARAYNKDKWSQMMKREDVRTLLAKTKRGRRPRPDTVFPFENFNEDFEGVFEREFGVCSGFATLQRNFNILMHFDVFNRHGAKVPSKENEAKYYDYYYKLIDKASAQNPVIIPGYKNINEFLTDPKLMVYAKKAVGKMWAQNNASLQGAEQLNNYQKTFHKSHWKSFYQNLKKRLDVGYNPLIYASFASTPEIKRNIHVIQVMGISDYDLDNETDFNIYIWDDGVLKDYYGPFAAHKLIKVVNFRKNGTILWLESEKYLELDLDNMHDKTVKDLTKKKLIDKTFWIDLLPNDDARIATVVEKKLTWCQSKAEFKKYCK